MPFLSARGKESKGGEMSSGDVDKNRNVKVQEDWKNDISLTLPPLALRLHEDGVWRPFNEAASDDERDNDTTRLNRSFRNYETLKGKNNLLRLKVETLIEMIIRKNMEIERLKEEMKK